MTSNSTQLIRQIVGQLTDALATEGFTPSNPLDGVAAAGCGTNSSSEASVWFARIVDGVPQLTAAVNAHIQRNGRFGMGITAGAWVVSKAAQDILQELPAEALSRGSWPLGRLESVNFGFFERTLDPGEIPVGADPDYAVSEYMRLLRGPVEQWFSRYSSSSELLATARTATVQSLDQNSPNPVRIRATVVLLLLNELASDAVALMDWYLRHDRFHKWDSIDRAVAFDIAISNRFPAYALARTAVD
ncbi:hypothetical protein [Nocardia sp. CC227C]|uniref:hypothetical protein n=1 Tax=Nocardia sp. CC227C TaxID=3044562 RepID=UPI00278C67A7|nr:hypothetical protein [Nocardia sp. CC227C]